MEDLTQPRVSNSSNGLVLSYEIPQRVHTVQVYPVESPNGSTVIIYGHENGVRLIWRGGRRFKSQAAKQESKELNGTGKAVVLLDSDDEDGKPYEDHPEFEDEEDELDSSKPYPDIVQVLDLSTGVDVLQLGLLTSSILKSHDDFSDIFKKRLIFTAACADNRLRLVDLPLTPPSPKSKARLEFKNNFASANLGNGNWGEKVVMLHGHLKPSDGLSMTIDLARGEPDIIVASHSREVTGRLLLWRSSLKSPRAVAEYFQSLYLASPAKSISFNPSLFKSNYLLVAEAIGVCRIFDYRPSRTQDEIPETPSASQGRWLLSLYTGFQNIKPDSPLVGAHAGHGRKTIVDAQWISDGRAVIVLLEKGEWAMWDIEGIGPGTSQGLLSRKGITGGSKSEYSVTGFIDCSKKPKRSGPPQLKSSRFAPMTPVTRKSLDPFSSRGTNRPARGQISVIELPASTTSNTANESVLFWLDETYVLIPNLTKYWASHAGSGDIFKSQAGALFLKLDDIDLQGEHCTAIAQIPKSSSPLPDIIILGEHRFVLLNSGRPPSATTGQLVLTERLANNNTAQTESRELDVMALEMALAHIENRNGLIPQQIS